MDVLLGFNPRSSLYGRGNLIIEKNACTSSPAHTLVKPPMSLLHKVAILILRFYPRISHLENVSLTKPLKQMPLTVYLSIKQSETHTSSPLTNAKKSYKRSTV